GDSAAHGAPQSCSLARMPASRAGSPCGEGSRAPSAASIIGGGSQPPGGSPGIPGSLATHAAGDPTGPARVSPSLANLPASSLSCAGPVAQGPGVPTRQPRAPAGPPALQVSGSWGGGSGSATFLAQQPGATACRPFRLYPSRVCGPTPRCREVKPR